MNIHLFTNESLYSYELLKLFESTLKLNDHLFIFRKEKTGKYIYTTNVESRIIYSTNFSNLLINILPKLKAANWIYFHYLPYGPSLILWALQPSLIVKSTWIVWGSDVFIYKQSNLSLKNYLFEFLRRIVIPGFPEIAAFVEEDAREAMLIYKTKAQYIPILYPLPVNLDNLKDLKKQTPTNSKNILIGNSSDPSNNHLEILDLLYQFANEDINIFCPLSTYGDVDYIASVIKKGKNIFGDKFISMHTMLTTKEYAEFMNDMDIAIMNHNRQQGLGNILPLLYLGKKVYVRSDISTFPFLINAGCVIFDTCSMNKSNFASFISLDNNSRESNKKAIEKLINPDYYTELWNNLFSKHQ
jgi:dTDP-N-acetylfucosamine:lipid II N-acetylfucosaminyltransferase